MGLKRLAANVAAAALLTGGVSLAVAPAASAATYDVEAQCTAINTVELTVRPGDVVNYVYGNPPTNCGTFTGTFSAGPIFSESNSSGILSLSILSTATPGQTGFAFAQASDAGPFATLKLTVGGGPSVPAWVQAYGRFGSDAPCEDGWSPSWQKWAEPITGGWVCTRSIPSLG